MLKWFKARTPILIKHKIRLVCLIAICIALIVALGVVPVKLWFAADAETIGITTIRGDSMSPTIENGAILYIQPVKFARGEIVIADCPNTTQYTEASDVWLLKRIVGIPGDSITITENGLVINGTLLEEEYIDIENETLRDTNDINEIVLSDGEYFLLGDNRVNSFDSRHVGAVHRTEFIYGITTEPNDYTREVWGKAAIVAVANLVGIISLSFVAFTLLTIKPKDKATMVKESINQKTINVADTAVDANQQIKKSQPKSKKNQKREERARRRHNN